MSDSLEPVSLLCPDGDSYIVDLVPKSLRQIRIVRIQRFANNRNTDGQDVPWPILTLEMKRRIVKRINAVHIGRTVVLR